jgi:hypothetical protein
MKMKYLICIIIITAITCPAMAQQLPLNTCGIVNTYDAAGNRLKRVYFCNNGVDPYPARRGQEDTKTTNEYQYVDALYPNPTTGKFFITFSKSLQKAQIAILDVNGKVMSVFQGNGNKVEFDLSPFANGVYFVRINDTGNIILKKVVKQ